MALIRCRHCSALVVPGDARCEICRGWDPSGWRHALLRSLFLGGLCAVTAAAAFVAGLWWKWHRWLALFGEPDDWVATDHARNMAGIAAAFVFLAAWLAAATLIHRKLPAR